MEKCASSRSSQSGRLTRLNACHSLRTPCDAQCSRRMGPQVRGEYGIRFRIGARATPPSLSGHWVISLRQPPADAPVPRGAFGGPP